MSVINLIVPGVLEGILLRALSNGSWATEDPSILRIDKQQETDLNSDSFIVSTKGETLDGVSNGYIIDLFEEKLADLKKLEIDQNMTGVEVDPEDEESWTIPRPNFDPEQIRVEPKILPLAQVIRYIDIRRIDLSPDFQRFFVWKDVSKQSRLIESLLLRIPLPAFYLSEDDEGLYQVVDGLQRLTTIHRFMNNEHKLKNLEYLADCEGRNFDSLAPKYQRRLEDTQFSFNVIAPTTPISVKFEIFKRINEGGKPLNRQEIRNSMAKPSVRGLIQHLSNMDTFQRATGYSVKPIRMEDQELILRFIGFYIIRNIDRNRTYRGDMERFLDDTLDYLNRKFTDRLFEEFVLAFDKSMHNSYYLFGRFAFRKVSTSHVSLERKSLINKSLFTVWSVLLAAYDPEAIELQFNQNELVSIFAARVDSDSRYFEALTTGTNQANKIEYGFEVAEEILTRD